MQLPRSAVIAMATYGIPYGVPVPQQMMPPITAVSLEQVPGVLIVESTQLADILLEVGPWRPCLELLSPLPP